MSDEDDLVDESPAAKPERSTRSAKAPTVRSEPQREGGQRKAARRTGGEKSIFDLPDALKAQLEGKGLSAEFKRMSYFGKEEDADYLIDLQENGWDPLSLSSFPDFKKLMPKNWNKDTFEKRGQMLMIRPIELTEEARAEEKKKAEGQVKGQLATLKEAGQGEAARTLAKVSRSYERGVPID